MREDPKFKVGDKVTVQSWTHQTKGVVIDIDWMYHPRMYEYTWGYRVDTKGENTGLTFNYIPEGYLRPLDEGPSD